jgi:hypothetical protein
LLASCSWLPFGGKKAERSAKPACPDTVILHPLANTATFAPGAEVKPLYVAFYGIYSDISSNCTVNGSTLHVALDSIIVAERGPAAKGNDVDFTYFVALTGADQSILGKKSFGVHVSVPQTAKRGGVSDHVEVDFATGGQPVTQLNLTVGFQESPQAVEFYKNYRGR